MEVTASSIETYGALLVFAIIIIGALIKINGRNPKPEKKINVGKLKFDHDKIGGTLEDRFFVECVLLEIDDFTIPKNVEKAKALAESYRVDISEGVENVFEKAKAEHLEMNRRRRESGNYPTGDDAEEEYDE